MKNVIIFKMRDSYADKNIIKIITLKNVKFYGSYQILWK